MGGKSSKSEETKTSSISDKDQCILQLKRSRDKLKKFEKRMVSQNEKLTAVINDEIKKGNKV